MIRCRLFGYDLFYAIHISNVFIFYYVCVTFSGFDLVVWGFHARMIFACGSVLLI